ncbi:MAG: histidine phosphatase family protein, partial [Dokdonella sp.]
MHLIRHGQASFGADDYDCLSELGVRQSRLLGEWMQRCGETPTRIVIGPMLRHRQTADASLSALVAGAQPPVETLPGFAEFDHLDVLGRFRAELADARALREFLETSEDPRVAFQSVFRGALQRWLDAQEDDYVESWSAFKRRCIAALTRLTDNASARQSVWVFTSGGPIAVIVQ